MEELQEMARHYFMGGDEQAIGLAAAIGGDIVIGGSAALIRPDRGEIVAAAIWGRGPDAGGKRVRDGDQIARDDEGA